MKELHKEVRNLAVFWCVLFLFGSGVYFALTFLNLLTLTNNLLLFGCVLFSYASYLAYVVIGARIKYYEFIGRDKELQELKEAVAYGRGIREKKEKKGAKYEPLAE